jgi:hypothetical protein
MIRHQRLIASQACGRSLSVPDSLRILSVPDSFAGPQFTLHSHLSDGSTSYNAWFLTECPGPPDFDLNKFEYDLHRQDSRAHRGWQVYRSPDRQLAGEPKRVEDQLALFLERVPGPLEVADFLPKQSGASAELNLRTH